MAITAIIAGVLLLGSFAVSALLTGIVRRLSPRIGLIDHPGGHKQHGREVPLGGGLAILATIGLAVLLGAAAIVAISRWHPGWLPLVVYDNLAGLRDKIPGALLMVLGAAVLSLLGLVDDYRPLGPWIKLAVEIAVVVPIIVLLNIRLMVLLPPALSIGLTVIWVVTIVNSFNFLDNMDGLAGGVVVVCGLIFTAAAAINGQLFVPAMLLVVVGAAGGFLLHNFPPARIFMGDSGSLVLGYFMGLLTVLVTRGLEHKGVAVLMPLIILAIPLYDTVSVCVLRISQGRNPMKGDHSHFSHRLLARGMSVRAALLTIYLATCATGLAAVFLMQVPVQLAWIVFVQTMCIIGIIALLELRWPQEKDR